MQSNSVTQTTNNRNKRPLFINVLIAFHLLGGGFYVLSFVIKFFRSVFIAPDAEKVMIHLVLTYIVFLICGSIWGMWKGKKYGWWCTTLFYMALLVKTFIQAGVSVGIIPINTSSEEYFSEYAYVFIVISFFLYSYVLWSLFSKNNIIEYFNIEEINKIKAILIQLGLTVAYFGAGQLFFGAL